MKSLWRTSGAGQYHPAKLVGERYAWCGSCEGEGCRVRGDWAGKCVGVHLLNGAWTMVGGDGVQGRYGQVGSSMRGMARLRRVAAISWAGVSCARVS